MKTKSKNKVILPKISKKLLWGLCPFCKYGPTAITFEWQTLPMCHVCAKSKFEEAGIKIE